MKLGKSGPPALLLMSCSQRKTAGLARGPAWDVYDGQLFRILKKLLATHPDWDEHLRILIVSAKYGVIPPDQVIDTYEERLTAAAAHRRGALWAAALKRAVARQRFRGVHINLGKDYLTVLPDLERLFQDAVLDQAQGGIGSRNAQTRSWVLAHLPQHHPFGLGEADELG